MDLKKLSFSNQILSPKTKVVSGFGLGVVSTLIVFTVVLLSSTINSSVVRPLFQGFDNGGLNSSVVTWPFSLSSGLSSDSAGDIADEIESAVDQSQEANVSGVVQKEESMEAKEEPMMLDKTQLGNFSEIAENGSFNTEEGRVHQNAHGLNGSIVVNNSSVLDSNGRAAILKKTHLRNSSEVVNEKESIGGNYVDNSISVNGIATENNNMKSFSNNGELGRSPSGEEPAPKANHGENWAECNETTLANYDDSQIKKIHDSSSGRCDIFDGKWVKDDSKPYYPAGSCPYIDRDFDCHLNGRPDSGFVKWRWQPNGCNIPRLNATDFLERLRGKKLVFVGDSLNRNMWESLVCILRHSVKNKKRVYEISGKTKFKKKGVYAFRFEDYNCSVDFVGAPFLVRESSYNGRNGTIETLRLDLMDRTTSMYHDAEIIIFNTGHWWTHEKTSKGEDYYQEGNYVHPRLKVLEAYKRALTTWARWIDKNIDNKRTQIFFRGYSVTHFRGGQWNSGGQCHKETEPISNETYLEKYPSKMRALENVVEKIKTPVIYMNISQLTDYRKDGHPSIYRMKYKTVQDQIASERSQDCSHWCLPGVPDTWNELLYASLLKVGRGSWRN